MRISNEEHLQYILIISNFQPSGYIIRAKPQYIVTCISDKSVLPNTVNWVSKRFKIIIYNNN